MHIMLDLETMSLQSNAAIVAIGAVQFSAVGLGQRFYHAVDLRSSVEHGGHMDPGTVLWWLHQSNDALKLFDTPTVSLPYALDAFSNWVNATPGPAFIWGYGADFDNVILGNAYRRLGKTAPWSYKNSRCFRTLANSFPEVAPPDKIGIKHNALDDAVFEAEHAIKIFNYVDGLHRLETFTSLL